MFQNLDKIYSRPLLNLFENQAIGAFMSNLQSILF